MLVVERLLLRRRATLVSKRDFQPGIEKGQLAQSRRQSLELKFSSEGENRRVRQKSNECAGVLFVFDFADDAEFLSGFTALESHVINLGFTSDFHLKPVTQRIDAFRTHPMQAARILVRALTELSARVQIGED